MTTTRQKAEKIHELLADGVTLPVLAAWSDELADDVLALVPADDDEPVTEEWLLGNGFDCVSTSGVMGIRSGFRNDWSHPLRNTSAAHEPLTGRWFANGLGCAPCKTRGQVRRLLTALGITQPPSKAEQQ